MKINSFYAGNQIYYENFFRYFNNVYNSVSSNQVDPIIEQGLFPTVSGTTVTITEGICQGLDVTIPYLDNNLGATIPTRLQSLEAVQLTPIDGFVGFIVANLVISPISNGSTEYIFTTSVTLVESVTAIFPSGNLVAQIPLCSISRTGSVVTINLTNGAFRVSYSNLNIVLASAIAGGAAQSLLIQTDANVTGFIPTQANSVLLTNSIGGVDWGLTLPNSMTTATSVNTPSTIMLRDINSNSSINAIIESQTFTAGGSPIALSVTSSPYQNITGSGSTTITLPDATTLYLYQSYKIANMSTGTVIVNNSASTTIATLIPGTSGQIVLSNNSTAPGIWSNITMGVVATATTLLGGVLGSLPYQSTVNTTVFLPPNTTATKLFLSQTGTGSVGAPPAWASLPVESSWTTVTGTSQALVSGGGYYMNNAALVTGTLPTASNVGDKIIVDGSGAGGWKIAQNANQFINFGDKVTTTGTGGSLSSTNQFDGITLRCRIANLAWSVESVVGNIAWL